MLVRFSLPRHVEAGRGRRALALLVATSAIVTLAPGELPTASAAPSPAAPAAFSAPAAGAAPAALTTLLARRASTTRASRSAPRRSVRAAAIGFGLAQLGKPYRRGGTGPATYDCSGLVSAGFRSGGVGLPRRAVDQYLRLPHLPRAKARPGDLLFWGSDPRRPASVYHVALYLGGGMILTAPRAGTRVQIKPVYRQGLMPYAARVPSAASADLLPVKASVAGPPVVAVQRRLRAQGLRAPVTGRYDRTTADAVRAFQRRAHQRPTGVVDDASWAILVRAGHKDRLD